MRVFHALAPSHRAVAALALAAGVLVGEAGCLASPRDGVVFQSDWSTDTGTSRRAVTDDGRWKKYYEFNASGFQLLSVVPEGPGGRNALRVLQRGVHFAAEVEQDNVLPPSKDFYVRFYMRNDDTSQTADHAVEPGLSADFWNNLIYVRKTAAPNGWRTVVGTMNGRDPGPRGLVPVRVCDPLRGSAPDSGAPPDLRLERDIALERRRLPAIELRDQSDLERLEQVDIGCLLRRGPQFPRGPREAGQLRYGEQRAAGRGRHRPVLVLRRRADTHRLVGRPLSGEIAGRGTSARRAMTRAG